MTITSPFTSGTTHAPPPPSAMDSTEHATAILDDVIEALWPATGRQTVEWRVACDAVEIGRRESLAEAERFALGCRAGHPHTITLVKLDRVPS